MKTTIELGDAFGIERTTVIRRTENQVVVLCPYCKKEHFHGKVGIPGYRVAHCMNGKQYEIIENPVTT